LARRWQTRVCMLDNFYWLISLGFCDVGAGGEDNSDGDCYAAPVFLRLLAEAT